MADKPLPNGISLCPGCLHPFARKLKGGEVRVTLTAKPGVSITMGAPICSSCASKAHRSPELSVAVLRDACPKILAGTDGDFNDR